MSDARIAKLQATIAARDQKPGYARNVAALKAELAKLLTVRAAEKAESASLVAALKKSVVAPTPQPETPAVSPGLTSPGTAA